MPLTGSTVSITSRDQRPTVHQVYILWGSSRPGVTQGLTLQTLDRDLCLHPQSWTKECLLAPPFYPEGNSQWYLSHTHARPLEKNPTVCNKTHTQHKTKPLTENQELKRLLSPTLGTQSKRGPCTLLRESPFPVPEALSPWQPCKAQDEATNPHPRKLDKRSLRHQTPKTCCPISPPPLHIPPPPRSAQPSQDLTTAKK